MPCTTPNPSRGGSGIRLKSARLTLVTIMTQKKLNTAEGKFNPSRSGMANSAASTRLEKGPAADVSPIPTRGLVRMLYGFTGTGLPQPIPQPATDMNTIITAPRGSKCAIGFSVNRPRLRAVESPNS